MSFAESVDMPASMKKCSQSSGVMNPVYSAMSNFWSCSHKYSVMKRTELPKKSTTQGEGGLFIEHLIVHIRACHCMDIMVASAIIIQHSLVKKKVPDKGHAESLLWHERNHHYWFPCKQWFLLLNPLATFTLYIEWPLYLSNPLALGKIWQKVNF